MKKVLFATLVALAALVSCNKNGGKVDPVLPEATLSAPAEFVDGSATVDVVLSAAATEEVTAKLELSGDLNADNVAFNPSVVVKAGQAKASVKVTINPTCPDGEYNVTLTLKEVKNAVLGAKNSATIKAIVEPAPEAEMCVDITDFNAANSVFMNEAGIVLGPNHTMQTKFFSTHWHPYGKADEEFPMSADPKKAVYCNRLVGFYNASEKGYLYRYGDGGENGSLRLNCDLLLDTSNGKDYVGGQKRVWTLGEWHVVTVATDETTCRVYDNGELVGEIPVKYATGFKFQRFDISMSWDDGYGYPEAQNFHGYLAYVRVWNKTLTESEIAANLCSVDPKAEGLVVNWKFNTDEGSKVSDQCGNWNLDFDKALDGDGHPAPKGDAFKACWVDWDPEEHGGQPFCALAE